ncbi:MAG: DUF5050 domain-containing protein [Lachnospiraceae bacterium]|nr:DUF5050 domain-containing protein [Lachnospiraceae bacterium]
MNNKKKAVLSFLIIGAVVLILALAVITNMLGNQVTPNPVGTVGNRAGNLNNSGLFCEHDGKVYFANSYDNYSLYVMEPSEEGIQKINDVTISNILAGGKYLYYFRAGAAGDAGLGSILSVKSFNRCELDGDKTESLLREVVTKAQLVDNQLYLLIAGAAHPEFYKMNIDGSELSLLADYEINPACAENSVIYYNGTQYEHYLYGLDTATDVSSEIWKGNLWYPIKQGDYVYFMDVAENYRLCRYSLTDNIVEVLTNDRVDCYNLNHDYIYYQANGTSPALKCMNIDGSNPQIVAEGNYTNINVTSQYVYFQEYGDATTMYHSYLGSRYYDAFTLARNAVLSK